ncbi:unnamed protein product [Gadus morhua 'NCC']
MPIRGAMRRLRSLMAMVLLGAVFLVLVLSNWQIDTAEARLADQEPLSPGSSRLDPPGKPVWRPKTLALAPTQAPTPALAKLAAASKHPVLNVTVSDDFRKFFPHNTAYWSRLLHVFLRQHDRSHTVTPPADWNECEEASLEVLKTNVHDFDTYPDLHKNFLRMCHCRNPPLLREPKNCTSEGSGPFLLLAIKSAPSNFQRRQAVRETWGTEGVYLGGLSVRTIFLLGSSSNVDPDLSPLLEYEARRHQDVLQWDFHESLFNLTLKFDAFFKWTWRNCRDASFVFSGDDDVFVNTPAILEYLRALAPEPASRLYVGQVISPASPIRDAKSKYYIPPSYYEGGYPPYAGGGGFLFSGALLGRLAELSSLIPLFPIDDVYVGMCIHALGVAPEKHPGFQTFDVAESNRENMCVHKELMVIHRRTPREVKRLWKGIHSPSLTC